MAKSREHFALDWIKGELLETLNDARQALEAYVESDSDQTRMRACLTALHQVHGTLVMLELPGIALLADHLERLAERMLAGSLADEPAAAQLLMQGILELPGHLDDIQAGAKDSQERVRELVNEIRSQLGEPPLASSLSVTPIASITAEASEQSISRFENIDGAEKTRRIRAAYQQALLSILKGEPVANSLDRLDKVAKSLQRVCEGAPHEQLWEAFGEFVAGLARHEGPLSAASIKLLRRVDSEIRTLGQEGVNALRAPVSVELLARLLDGAAALGHSSHAMERLREALTESGEAPEPEVSSSGRQALSSAAAALREELLLVKDKLDLIVRTGGDVPSVLESLIAPLKQIGSTLSLLGFESSRAIVADQIEALTRLLDAEEDGGDGAPDLDSIASALVQVDENLASFSTGGRSEVEKIVDEAQKAVTVEARRGLEQVKQDVVDFISAQWDPRHLSETPERIAAICGALEMIPLARASRLLADCGRYVRDSLTQGQTPSWQDMDHFADAISGLDYYLERIAEQTSFGAEDVLDLVERSLETLIPAAGEEVVEAAAEPSPEPTEESFAESTEESFAEPTEESFVDPSPEPSAVEALSAFEEPAADEEQSAAAPLPEGEEPVVELRADLDEEEQEPPLAMDDDPGFDLDFLDYEEDEDERSEAPAVEPQPTTGDAVARAAGEEPLTEPVEPPDEELNPGSGLDPDSEPAVQSPQPFDLPPTRPQPRLDPTLADNFESDEEIVEIFVEEVDEVLATVDEWLGVWSEELGNEEALSEVRRSFHTLKGSGRIVGANVIGELAWSVENMLNRLIDGTVEATAEFPQVVSRARALVPELKDAFEIRAKPDMLAVAELMEMADVLASGGTLDSVDSMQATVAETVEPAEDATVSREATVDAATAAEADSAGADAAEVLEPAVESADTAPDPGDPVIVIFLEEAASHLRVLRAGIRPDAVRLDESFLRALHTLAGSAGMAGCVPVESVVRPAYELASLLKRADQDLMDEEVVGFFNQVTDALAELLDGIAANRDAEIPEQLLADADRLLVAAQDAAAADERRQGAALATLPGMTDILAADEFLGAWQAGSMDPVQGDRLLAALGEVSETAAESGLTPVAELAQAFSTALAELAGGGLDSRAFEILTRAHAGLLAQLDALAADQSLPDSQSVIRDLQALARGAPETVEPEAPRSTNVVEFPADEAAGPRIEDTAAEEELSTAHDEIRLDDLEEQLLSDVGNAPAGDAPEAAEAGTEVETELALEPEVAADAAAERTPAADSGIEAEDVVLPAAVAELLPDEVDEEIIEVFFEEADEILESVEENIHRWASEPDNQVFLEHLLRGLHTLKGGARLSGLTRLGDEAHQLESLLVDAQSEPGAVDDGFFDTLHTRFDELTNLLSVIRRAMAGEPVEAPEVLADPAAEAAASAEEDAADLQSAERAEIPAARVAAPPEQATGEKPGAAQGVESRTADRDTGQVPETAKREIEGRPGQEIVRVGAGLLEELVNLAGESSILRARVEQGMSDFTAALEEMETTIERLREQLRRLEIETEAQILFRQDRPEGPAYEDFDPLEMDRYSQLQQLSRGLSESASDMLDLKETLLFKARESETLLLQQARINTELQEGLMRTRMVPFSRLLPRLRRTVRQVAGELGKDVEFHAYNVEGELDRSLLERMVPPLEHMLRNAVDHGIEAKELRANFGKPVTGRIDLRLSREGGDVVIEISDDGAGIDVESVREKAIERGLMSEGARLTEDEIVQFVLAPGFTTAKSVTQISGRGVGMDVVASEVKQLGGSIQIASRPGKGTRFTVRVPFTVSVNRALMVSVGEDLYAIPLNNIEGIVLLTPDELERLYAPDGNTFEYAGIPYRVRYLGHYLGREFRVANQHGSVPVVLVRSGDHAVAVHVDGVQGSREIVVKSLGPQFAGVGGISGATILGDGSVVVILDLLALIRSHGGDRLVGHRHPLAAAARTRCVMVVDDSVTVRKVTSRLLERQGMDVIVAKDGVEAISLLQERRPDVMLLDIEMPRMDGFEVARQVRHDERLAGLPIVMISSRTGEKHQERAAELGVNSFLGKPFQENELLETIDRLVD